MECADSTAGWLAIGLAILLPMLLIGLAVAVVEIVGIWYMFVKAGEPGWAILIPFVNIVIVILVLHGISKNFGQDGGFTVGLFFLGFIFFPILGFGKAKYIGDKSAFT